MKTTLLTFLIAFINFTTNVNAQKANLSIGQKPADLEKSGFYENKGQIVDQNYKPNSDVNYLFSSKDFNVALRQTGFSYDTYTDVYDSTIEISSTPNPMEEQFQKSKKFTRSFHRVDIELEGCATNAQLIAEGRSEAGYNYFTSGTPQGGVSDVHYFQKVSYKNIYPNIDLEFFIRTATGSAVPIEYQFVIHKGGNPSDIKLAYRGANKVSLRGNTIMVNVSAGNFAENIPSSYFKNNMEEIEVSYVAMGNNTFAFSLPKNTVISSDFVIDPTPNLQWATYFGGTGNDIGNDIVLDGGNVFITGSTASASNIATAGVYKTIVGGGEDAFVAKFNPNGDLLLWATYYGGTGDDAGIGMTIDASSNIYIIGSTNSTSNIATSGAAQTSYGGVGVFDYDIFIAKFNASGNSLFWATYYGGAGSEAAYNAIALDTSNNVYITGATTSTSNIATVGAYLTFGGGSSFDHDVFIAKFASTGASLLWGTYYGGTGIDQGMDLALDVNSNVHITGPTSSTNNIATSGAYLTTFGAGNDVFVAKFNSTGTALLFGTYYGGTGSESAGGIRIDASNNVYIVGTTTSTSNIATTGAYQSTKSGGYDAFVAKFDPTGTSLIWGTYYGGTANDGGKVIAFDANNDIYITGNTHSTSNIATACAYQTVSGGGSDAFLAKFNSTVTTLLWATYYGGPAFDRANGIAFDASNDVYIIGPTLSTSNIATSGAYKTTAEALYEVFIARFSESTCAILPIELLSFTGKNQGTTNLLEWTSATEINNDYYTLERSIDGLNFETLDIVDGAGNSTTALNYSLVDVHPHKLTYYRLKQTDFDGAFTYSQTIAIAVSGIDIITIYPNPMVDNFQFLISSSDDTNVKLFVTDVLGRTVLEKNIFVVQGLNTNTLDVSTLSNGTYMLQVITSKGLYKAQKQFSVK